MFFYGYKCYMRKHGIISDILKIPSDDETEPGNEGLIQDKQGTPYKSAVEVQSSNVAEQLFIYLFLTICIQTIFDRIGLGYFCNYLSYLDNIFLFNFVFPMLYGFYAIYAFCFYLFEPF